MLYKSIFVHAAPSFCYQQVELRNPAQACPASTERITAVSQLVQKRRLELATLGQNLLVTGMCAKWKHRNVSYARNGELKLELNFVGATWVCPSQARWFRLWQGATKVAPLRIWLHNRCELGKACYARRSSGA